MPHLSCTIFHSLQSSLVESPECCTCRVILVRSCNGGVGWRWSMVTTHSIHPPFVLCSLRRAKANCENCIPTTQVMSMNWQNFNFNLYCSAHQCRDWLPGIRLCFRETIIFGIQRRVKAQDSQWELVAPRRPTSCHPESLLQGIAAIFRRTRIPRRISLHWRLPLVSNKLLFQILLE